MTKNEDSALCAQNQLGTDDYIDHHNWFSNDVASNMVLAFGSLERFFVNLKRFIPYEDVVELRDKFSDMLFQKSVELSQTAKPFKSANYSETTRAIHRVTLHLRDGQTVQSDFLSPTEEAKFLREHLGLYDSAVSEVYECTGAVKFTGDGVETVPIRTEPLRALRNPIVKYLPKAGDIVKFGSYPQDTSTPEAIEWIVLDVDSANNRALLVSSKVIDLRRYHEADEYVSWETCSLRTWLNSAFLDEAFSAEEQNRIHTTIIHNDKVFCLSVHDVFTYFADDTARMAKTSRNVANGVSEYYGFACWWLCSMGRDTDNAAGVLPDGHVLLDGYYVDDSDVGVRPALWLQY